MAIVQLIRLVY